jgi:anti-sigma B factor antagonist
LSSPVEAVPETVVSYATVRELAISTEQVSPTASVLVLTGEIDLYTCPELKTELLRVIEDGATLVVIDFAGTTFIDSTGLGVLIRGVERLRMNEGSLAVVSLDPNLTKIFEVTGLDRVFSIYDSREEALGQAPS